MIDPKELHVGAHVDYDGKRMIVVCISGAVHGADISLIEPTEKAIYKDVWACNIEPIPITEELLTELGFEKEVLNTLPFPTTRYIDAESAKYQADNKDAMVVPKITLVYMNLRNPFWRVLVLCDELITQCEIGVRYLHELEAFLYLTTKTELIKE